MPFCDVDCRLEIEPTLRDRGDSSNVGSVVECSPATRAARVRFPDVAIFYSLPTSASLDSMYFHVHREGAKEEMQEKREEKKSLMEAPGIDPGTSRMLSERSTI